MGNGLETVQVLLNSHADPDTVTKKKNCALHKASKQGHIGVITALLQHRACANLQNVGGATPLMIAVANDREDIVSTLIQGRADVNKKKDVGYTALMMAARMGRLRHCQVLIQAKADVDMQDKQKETALTKAQKKRSEPITQLLLDHGADPKKGLPNYKTPVEKKEKTVTLAVPGESNNGTGGYPQA